MIGSASIGTEIPIVGVTDGQTASLSTAFELKPSLTPFLSYGGCSVNANQGCLKVLARFPSPVVGTPIPVFSSWGILGLIIGLLLIVARCRRFRTGLRFPF